MKTDFQQRELLPPLTKDQVANIIKFLRLNVDLVAYEFESCCASDDSDTVRNHVYTTLVLGYEPPEELRAHLVEIGMADADEDAEADDE